jgi:hypothetical protein
MLEVYFDKSEKKAFAAGVIPLYAQAALGKTHRALPIYDIMTDDQLMGQIGMYEFRRVQEVHSIVTKVMLGVDLPVDMIAPRYYKTEGDFAQDAAPPCKRVKGFDDSAIVRLISAAKKVCFAGDSVTDGTKNGGTGWQSPLMAHFTHVECVKMAWGGATAQTLLDHAEDIAASGADVYVVAVGTNDVRYRNPDICAMSADEYIQKLHDFTTRATGRAPMAKFAFVAPWLALSNDKYNHCDPKSKKNAIQKRDGLLLEYSAGLKEFCGQNGYLFLNPNPYLRKVFETQPSSKYLVDWIHPNRLNGVELYARAVLSAGLPCNG